MLLCDESGTAPPIAPTLAALGEGAGRAPWAVMCGPEGGYGRSELDGLRKLPFVTVVALGPRLLRAETAALAAVACWQAILGDWRTDPARAVAAHEANGGGDRIIHVRDS